MKTTIFQSFVERRSDPYVLYIFHMGVGDVLNHSSQTRYGQLCRRKRN